MMSFLRTIVVCMLAGIIAACSSSEAKKASDRAAKPPVAVETATAAVSALTDSIEVTGILEPKFSVDVKTQIPGLVKQVFVSEWVRVRKGQPLVRIDVPETEAMVKRSEAGIQSARAGQAQAQVATNRADREMARILKLKEAGLATQQSVDDTRTEQEAAKARQAASRAQINVAEEDLRQARARLSKGSVVAPMDGVVAMRNVNVGDLTSDAAVAKPIFRIVDNRLLNLTATVSSADSARVKVGQPLEFSVDSLPGKTFTGKVMYINPELSSTDRSLKIIAEVQNSPELLKGGLFAKGCIITGSRGNVLQVPRSAVDGLDLAAKKGTLFVIENNIARKRGIVTGTSGGDLVEVTAGLKAGEQYVVRGGFNIKEGDAVSVAAAQQKP